MEKIIAKCKNSANGVTDEELTKFLDISLNKKIDLLN